MCIVAWISLYLWVGMAIVTLGWDNAERVLKEQEHRDRVRIFILLLWPAAIIGTIIFWRKI